MAKQKRQHLIEQEKKRKGNRTISDVQLVSCYIASAVIVVLCIIEAMKPETVNPPMYYVLAALGVGFSVFITIRNNSAKKKPVPTGKRLK